MKKLIVLIVSLSLCAPTAFGYYDDRSNHKLLYGLILSAAGIVLAFHGFSMAKDNISQPLVEDQQFTWSKNQALPNLPWFGSATGQVQNTGNVDLKSYTVYVNYVDANNNHVGYTYQFYDGMKMGETVTWTLNDTYCGSAEPMNAVVTTDLQYDAIYRTRQQNQTEGIVGVVVFGVGAYLMIDYALNINKFDTYMQRHDIDVRLAASRQSIGFQVCKKM